MASASECVIVSRELPAPIASNRRFAPRVELEPRRTTVAHHFDALPEHVLRVTGSERFHRGFLRSKSSGKMNRRFPPPHAVGDFALGEDALDEAIAVPLDCGDNAGNVSGVDAKPDDGGHTS